jgi:uncharacterized membrane protein
MVPKSKVRELDMTVDEALKYVISMGVVSPRRTSRGNATERVAPVAPLEKIE